MKESDLQVCRCALAKTSGCGESVITLSLLSDTEDGDEVTLMYAKHEVSERFVSLERVFGAGGWTLMQADGDRR